MKRSHTKLRQLTSALILAIGLLAPSGMAFADGASSVYLNVPDQTVGKGSNVSVPIRLDAAGTEINTVNVVLTFPQDKLTFVSLDKAGSYFDTAIPASPKASNGRVEFSVSSIGNGPTTDDVAIGNAVFTAKADEGTASLSLDGSAAANNGDAIDLLTSGGDLTLGPSTGNNSNAIAITAVKVSSVTHESGTITWKTSVATTSQIDYGTSDKYGFSASDGQPTTDHSITLDKKFRGGTLVHYRITATDEAAHTNQTPDASFTTLGYPVRITVLDADGKVLSGATVKIANGAGQKTGSDGTVSFTNVAAGPNQVVINGGGAQTITVKQLNDAAADKAQEYKLTYKPASHLVLYLSGIAVVLLLGWLVYDMYNRRKKAQTPASKS
jgi:hypothetical protein